MHAADWVGFVRYLCGRDSHPAGLVGLVDRCSFVISATKTLVGGLVSVMCSGEQ